MKKLFKKMIKLIVPLSLMIIYSKYLKNKDLKKYFKKFDGLTVGNNTKISNNCLFEKGVKICSNITLNNVSIGKYSYITDSCLINNCSIGKYCSFAPNIKIGLGIHPTSKIATTHPAFYSTLRQSNIVYADKNYINETLSTKIGNDVWIGYCAIIKGGIVIGNGAIIGAGALVTKNVPPYAIVGGIPAKLIRYRFTNKEIGILEKLKWWDKSDEWLKKNWKKLLDIKKITNINN